MITAARALAESPFVLLMLGIAIGCCIAIAVEARRR